MTYFPTCQWFDGPDGCDRKADGLAGDVPFCHGCAVRNGLDLIPFTAQARTNEIVTNEAGEWSRCEWCAWTITPEPLTPHTMVWVHLPSHLVTCRARQVWIETNAKAVA